MKTFLRYILGFMGSLATIWLMCYSPLMTNHIEKSKQRLKAKYEASKVESAKKQTTPKKDEESCCNSKDSGYN